MPSDLALTVVTSRQSSAREHIAIIGWTSSWIPSLSRGCSSAESLLGSNGGEKLAHKYKSIFPLEEKKDPMILYDILVSLWFLSSIIWFFFYSYFHLGPLHGQG